MTLQSKTAALGLALIVGVLLVSGSALAAAHDDGCSIDTGGLMSKCGDYVKSGPKKKPSDPCCKIVKNTDINCACQELGGKLPSSMSMDNVCYVANQCHNPMTPGSKCGDYTVPQKCE